MKKTTDDFQSLRLVAAGVPSDTADMFFCKESAGIKTRDFTSIPCWSIPALWQYLFDHNGDMAFTFDTEQSTDELIEGLVRAAIMVKERE